MADRHAQAAGLALRSGDRLARLFARMGTASAPRGRVLSAYRQARRALREPLLRGDRLAVRETLAALRQAVQSAAADFLDQAERIGIEQAERELGLWDIPRSGVGQIAAPGSTRSRTDDLGAWLGPLEAQIAAVLALGADGPALVLGDERHAGVLTPGPVLLAGARLIATVALGAYEATIDEALRAAGRRDEFRKQAIAVIDRRTTDCCLSVHGQVQPLDKPFHLTGEPRYADYVDKPPFHWWCRTAIALVPADEADDALTQRMRAAALAERAGQPAVRRGPSSALGG